MPVTAMFHDRHAAGLMLARSLSAFTQRIDVVVLGMARGGVMVAAPIARELAVPLDTYVCRKLGVPGLEEVAFGAIAEGGDAPVFDVVHGFLGLSRKVVAPVLCRERDEIARRVRRYRDGMPHIDLRGKTVFVVDDGLATGATLAAAGLAIRRLGPARLIAAVPVTSREGSRRLAGTYDEVIALATPEPFGTVSDWYHDYAPVDDPTVRALLNKPACADDHATLPSPIDAEHEITIPIDDEPGSFGLTGDIGYPGTGLTPPRGLVLFAHGGGSSRASYRNRYLAARLRMAGWATLRVDLLLDEERAADADGVLRFDIDLISGRLLTAAKWCISQRRLGCDQLVLFGASTGAAAAMHVAAALPDSVSGVITRGGRIDLAAASLAQVRAPTLLVVGGNDLETLQRTQHCLPLLGTAASLRVIHGAGHTFEEAATLGRLGEVVTSWLTHQQHKARVARWISKAAVWMSRVRRAVSTA